MTYLNEKLFGKKFCQTLFVLTVLFLCPVMVGAQQETEPNIDPIPGPALVELGSHAMLNIPQGYVFLTGADVRELKRYIKEPVSGNEIGGLYASEADGEYEVYFTFHAEGYIRDDEKNDLDAGAILESLRSGNQVANEERRKLGGTTLSLVGWKYPPYYNESNHNLEWATNVKDDVDGEIILNHNTRILGRRGFISATMVCNPSQYNDVLGIYQANLNGLKFNQGETYADYRQGDKVAKYGLTALMTGGAAAVAAKSGLFKYLWKIIAGVGLAIAAAFGKIFGRNSA